MAGSTVWMFPSSVPATISPSGPSPRQVIRRIPTRSPAGLRVFEENLRKFFRGRQRNKGITPQAAVDEGIAVEVVGEGDL